MFQISRQSNLRVPSFRQTHIFHGRLEARIVQEVGGRSRSHLPQKLFGPLATEQHSIFVLAILDVRFNLSSYTYV